MDINFNSQSTGAATASEFAALNDNLDTPSGSVTVNDGGQGAAWTYTNNTGGTVVLELVTGVLDVGFSGNVQFDLFIDRDGDGTADQEIPFNYNNMPMVFDPGLPLPDGGAYQVDIENESGASETFFSAGVIRT